MLNELTNQKIILIAIVIIFVIVYVALCIYHYNLLRKSKKLKAKSKMLTIANNKLSQRFERELKISNTNRLQAAALLGIKNDLDERELAITKREEALSNTKPLSNKHPRRIPKVIKANRKVKDKSVAIREGNQYDAEGNYIGMAVDLAPSKYDNDYVEYIGTNPIIVNPCMVLEACSFTNTLSIIDAKGALVAADVSSFKSIKL